MAPDQDQNVEKIIEQAEASRTAHNPLTQGSARAAIEEMAASHPEAVNAAIARLTLSEIIAKADKEQIVSATGGEGEVRKEEIVIGHARIIQDTAEIVRLAETSRKATNPIAQEEARSDIHKIAESDQEALRAALAKLDAEAARAKFDIEHIKSALNHEVPVSRSGETGESIKQVARALGTAGVNAAADAPPTAMAPVVAQETQQRASRKI